ncbi:MAG: Post-segregation antitoxin CcdA, partial [Alphaproteobacteria bacterium]|nr:Post-segregation antitoxin CcdA [Alphaproteobacteria bacterium]
DEARRLRINVSETLERRLRTIVRGEREKRWTEENRDAIASINAFIDHHGLLASRLRFRPEHE